MAKGKLRHSESNNKITGSNVSFKNGESFTMEFEINEIPPSARTLLTKGYVQDEINGFSGATVSTRGRFMTKQEKIRCPNERSLYLYIQGHARHNIDMAVQKINEIINKEHQNSLNRPSRFTNVPPPLMSLHSGVTSVEKICIGMENEPQGFDLRGRIIGMAGANLLYIRGETGANVSLRGRGSQFVDPILGIESPEPLHLYIEHPKPEALQNAKQLAINLIQTMQSELQTYIQQQPPPIQPQQIIEQPQLQQTQFQTMNIGSLGQPNVVTIQHQDLIQHPQSSVVTLPTTILTATVAGGPGPGVTVPPPGVHIPPHSGPLVPPPQSQEMQTFMPPPPPPPPPTSVGQVQLIGPPSTVSQVQYQIHPGQPLQIQEIQPGSQSSPQSVTQMYVMSQPPPHNSSSQQNFISSSGMPVSAGTVSYVYTQPNVQRPSTPSHGIIETVNVNLQQPPPVAPINITQHPPPPLLHLHFPPPNFPQNQPPPPVPQTYQIQYQQVQGPSPQSQTQFVIQPDPEQHQHMIPTQFEGHHPQFHLQIPPPASTQTFLISNAQSSHGNEIQHQQEGPLDQGSMPQPVPPPQIVPPPPSNSINVLTNVPPPPPPPQVPSPQNAPWLYQPQHQSPQGQLQIQMPPTPLHNVPPPQYNTQHVQYQNGQIQYTIHSPPPLDPNEHQKQGLKRRFSDVEGNQEPPPYHCGPLPAQRHGTGSEGDRQQQMMHGPSPAGAAITTHNERKLLVSSTHPGEKRNAQMEHKSSLGNELNINGDAGPVPWQQQQQQQQQHASWGRPMPMFREGEPCRNLPPTNMPPPQIRPRGPGLDDHARSPEQNFILEHPDTQGYFQKPPPPHPLMQSICNPPPPPPPPPTTSAPRHPHHHHRMQHQIMQQQYQTYQQQQQQQAPLSCPPWIN